MKQFVTLLYVQIRILLWPLIIVTACIPICALLGRDEGLSYLPALIAVVTVAKAASFLFAFEHREGNRNYLHTFPVSAAKLFWTKMLLLLFMTALAFVVLAVSSVSFMKLDDWHSNPLLFCIVSSLIFSSALFAVITKDSVRGFLWGSLICGAALYLIFQLRLFVIYTPIPFINSAPSIAPTSIAALVLFAGLFYFLPLLVLGILYSVYISKRRLRFSVPPLSIIVTMPLLGYLVFMGGSLHNEGRVFPEEKKTRILGAGRYDDRLVYVTDNGGHYPVRGYSLVFVSPDIGEAGIRRYRIPDPISERFEDSTVACFAGPGVFFMNVGLSEEQQDVQVYRIADGELAPTGTPFSVTDGYISWYPLSEDEMAIQCNHWSLDRETPTQVTLYRVNLVTGQAVREESNMMDIILTSEVNEGNRRYKIIKGEEPEEWSFAFRVAESDEWISLMHFNSAAIETPFEVDGALSAFLDEEIVVFDTSDASSPSTIRIKVPPRFLAPAWVSILPGIRDINSREEVEKMRISLAGGFLFLWDRGSSRAAVWDLRDLKKSIFLGATAVPRISPDVGVLAGARGFICYGTSPDPILRDDGALGLVLKDHGLTWFEFPKLMKG